MSNDPNTFKVEVCWRFVAKLMSLQKQLDPSYHEEHFLRDLRMTAVDILSIQGFLDIEHCVQFNSLLTNLRIGSPISRKRQVFHLHITKCLMNYQPQIRYCTTLGGDTWERKGGQLNHTKVKDQVMVDVTVEDRHKLTGRNNKVPRRYAE